MCVLDVGLFELSLRTSDGKDPVSIISIILIMPSSLDKPIIPKPLLVAFDMTLHG